MGVAGSTNLRAGALRGDFESLPPSRLRVRGSWIVLAGPTSRRGEGVVSRFIFAFFGVRFSRRGCHERDCVPQSALVSPRGVADFLRVVGGVAVAE